VFTGRELSVSCGLWEKGEREDKEGRVVERMVWRQLGRAQLEGVRDR
jgi:hypothetical protein